MKTTEKTEFDSEKESIKDVFEKWAGGSAGSSLDRFHPLFHKWWLEKLDLPEEGKALDVGCGTGWASRMVAKMVPSGEVVGIDIAEGMIQKAKQSMLKDKTHKYGCLSFKIADVENIPYPDVYFDCVMCLESFSWFPNTAAAVREMKRVLKPGSKLYMEDIPDSRLLRLILKFWKHFVSSLDKWNIYSEDEFKEFLEAEFKDVHQKKVNRIFQLIGERVLLTVGTQMEVDQSI